MALSVSDYKEIIRLTKEIKEEERELARLKAEGKKIDKERLETLKAELEVKRKGREEAESEYKTTEKLYKTATNLSKSIVGSSDELLERKKRIADYDASSNDLQLKASDALKKSSEFEETILRTKSKSNMLSFDSKSMIQEINEQLEIINEQYDEASDEQREILDNTKKDLKITEKKVRAMGEVADKAKGLKAAQDKIKELAGGYVDKLEAGLEMIKAMGKAIMENPRMAFAALGATIGKSISYGIARIKDMQQDLGAAREQAIELRDTFNDVGFTYEGFFGRRQVGFDLFGLALGADAGKLAGSLSNEMGTLQSVTEETVNQMMLFEKGLMVSGDTSAKLLQNFIKIRGESMETALKSMETVGALAIANEIPVNVLMKEIADNTETFAEFSIQGSNNIEMAAAQAKRLGVNLATTAKIANSLLDFESSIEREMRASLLIGRQLNYNRARQLALEGNIAGAAADVVSQLGGQAGFARLNVIQRRALAESIGVSVEELSRLASGRPIQLKSADEESRDKLRESTDALTNMMDNFLQKFGTGIGAILGSGLGTELLGQYIGFRGIGSIMSQIGMSLGLVTKPIVDATTGRRAGGIFGDMFNFFKRGQDDIIPGAERRLDLRRGFISKGEAKLFEALNKLNVTMDKSGRLRAPVGGIQIGNKFYKGGSLLPSPDKIMDAFDKSGRSLGKDVGRALDKTKVTSRGPRVDIPPKTYTDIGKKFGDGLSKFIKNNGSKMFKSLSLIGAGFEIFQTQKEVKALGGISNREAQRTVVDSITGFGGAIGGAKLGAIGGAKLLAPLGPYGILAGTILGGLLGGYAGYKGGEALGGAAFDMISPEQQQIDELKDTNDNIDKGLQSNATNIGAVAEKLAELATEVSLLKRANEENLIKVVTAVNNLNPQRA